MSVTTGPNGGDQADALRRAGLAGDVVVTGEAVALDLRPTGFSTRILSGLVDGLAYVIGLVTTLVLWARIAGSDASGAQWSTATIAIIASWLVLVPSAVETVTRGRSLGRVATSTTVVRDDGGPIGARHATVRALTGVIELWLTLGGGAIISSLASARGQRLGDRLAGTIVVSTRAHDAQRLPLVMPPELVGWAQGVTVRPMPAGLAQAARDLLARTALMTPEARGKVARSLAARIEPYSSRPAPAGTNPERFLAAVLVVRREAERARLAEAQDRENREAALMLALPHRIPDPR